jgi:hypothetical protein
MPQMSPDLAARLVSGRGQFVADLALDGCVEVCFIRSDAPHARVDRIDLRTGQGVTAKDLGLQAIPLEAGGMVPVAWPVSLSMTRRPTACSYRAPWTPVTWMRRSRTRTA